MSSRVRLVLGIVAGLLLLGGVIGMSRGVSATVDSSQIACGNGWSADYSAADQRGQVAELTGMRNADRYRSACADALGQQRGIGYTLLGLGVLGGVVLLVTSGRIRRMITAAQYG